MILERLDITQEQFERGTGWTIKPEGACRGDLCVPLGQLGRVGEFDLRAVAGLLSMPLVADEAHRLWSLGPASGGRSLAGADAPDFELPDWRGGTFRLGAHRGKKLLLLAWASW